MHKNWRGLIQSSYMTFLYFLRIPKPLLILLTFNFSKVKLIILCQRSRLLNILIAKTLIEKEIQVILPLDS